MKFTFYFLWLLASSAWAGQPAESRLPTPAKGVQQSRPLSSPGANGGTAGVSPVVGDADFHSAQQAFRAGDAKKLERLAQRMQKSPLEVYVSYYQLRLGLENADPQEVRAFLSRPEDTPMIDRLRGEWLKLLGKKLQWDLFDAEYPRLINEDAELACYAMQSRHRSQEQAVLLEARELWFNGTELPGSCTTLFELALSAGVIGEQDVLRRLRLALEANNVSLAQKLAGRLGKGYPGLSAELKSASSDMARYLEKLAPDKMNASQRIAALFALHRLAKQSPDLASARWAGMSASFAADEQRYYLGWLGYEAARNLDGRALQWYREAANSPLSERQMEWRVRAALRAQDWAEALASIGAMSPPMQREPVWIYWKARALQESGKPVEARNLFVLLSGEIHYYGQLARDELQVSPTMSEPVETYKPDRQAIDAMLALPGIQRTLALYRAGSYGDALEEWRWVLRNFNDRELLAAAEIARRNNMYDRAIGAADRTVRMHDFSLRYLAPYRDVLEVHIREQGLEEAWVYGLMRQESRFAHSAKSDAGAAGLMQIMPDTARWAAGRLGLKSYRTKLINQLDTNLRLGTYYMKTILARFDNNPVLATAAYNAGPLRAEQWRGSRPLEGAIYAENIPFEETRDYVKKVMSNTAYYAREFNAPPLPLKQRMGTVAPKAAVEHQAIPNEK